MDGNVLLELIIGQCDTYIRAANVVLNWPCLVFYLWTHDCPSPCRWRLPEEGTAAKSRKWRLLCKSLVLFVLLRYYSICLSFSCI